MAKIWKLKNQDSDAAWPGLPPLLARLLKNRGIMETGKAQEFLNPQYEGLHSPFLFRDMEKCVNRIWQAIENQEKICVYGDYDADAVTACAVLLQTFRHLGARAEYYIPDRFSEGYGVNLDALEKIKAQGATLVITVDCGTNSVDAAEWCRQNNIDLIITDHHEIIGPAPQAYGLINPKNSDDNYPYREITGVGVAFKLATAILENRKSEIGNRKFTKGYEKWLLDLVAIGTVADCHSLLGENRILVKYGLKVLQKTRWIGLRELIKSAGLDFSQKPPDSYTLGFVIAPRLNAAGRLEHAGVALDLLLETDLQKARLAAEKLEDINQRRQQLTQRVLSEAVAAAELIADRKVLAVMGRDWPKGVVGLVAGRLVEIFHKPAFVLEQGESEATGSARSVGEFNVVEGLKSAAGHLLKFGGHQQAAGLTLRVEQFEIFYQKLLQYADAHLSDDDLSPVLNLDAELDESELSVEVCRLLKQLEPFGVGNPRPKFFIGKAQILSARSVGAAGQHSQYQFKKGGRVVGGIAFNSAPLEKKVKVGDTVDIAAELMEDNWNNKSQVKLKIADLKTIDVSKNL